MLIVPPATAFLLTRKLPSLIAISMIVAVLSAVLGQVFSHIPALLNLPDTSSSGMIATATGFLFLLAWLFGPEGLIKKNSGELEKPPELD
jgi:manganese/zinc/iron transport system permease protein